MAGERAQAKTTDRTDEKRTGLGYSPQARENQHIDIVDGLKVHFAVEPV
jgi:hypothetical protein